MNQNFKVELTDNHLNNNSGLVIIGQLLNRINFDEQVEQLPASSRNYNISNAEILRSYIGLLALGKTTFEAIENYRNDQYFKQALNLANVPSCSLLRQRIEILSTKTVEQFILNINQQILKAYGSFEPALNTDLIPVDIDVTPMDNSRSKKEGVSCTYKKVDGFAPIMSYMGDVGHMINNQFRVGKAHSNCKGTADFLQQTMAFAQQLVPTKKILVRLDSGNDSSENIIKLLAILNSYFIIKKNFRREDMSNYTSYIINNCSKKVVLRAGKMLYYAEIEVDVSWEDEDKKIHTKKVRLVLTMKVTTSSRSGSLYLFPEIKIEGWFSNLPKKYKAVKIIGLYADHGTSEQFHSEFKTDMDMERLPSGKFEVNSLIMLLGQLAFNMLRIIGQQSLQTGLVKRKRKVKRIRLRKVLQDIMYLAAHYLVKHKRPTLQLAKHNIYSLVFVQIFQQLFG